MTSTNRPTTTINVSYFGTLRRRVGRREESLEFDSANVTIRYVVFVDGEVGIYGGAGFALPRGKAGDRSMGVDVGEASVELLDRTDGFVDVLGPARVTGSFTARLDDGQIRQLRHAVNQMVTNALGRTRLVDAEAVSRQLTAVLSAP